MAAFTQLGRFLSEFSGKQPWQGYSNGVSQADYEAFNTLISGVHLYNGWFTEENVRKALGSLADMLTEESLEKWLSQYPDQQFPETQKTVALIMAGNIPLVGFHDLLCTLLAGHRVLLKLSADDDKLLPFILAHLVRAIEPAFADRIRLASGKLTDFDAVIATGSDNSSRYFEYYFGKYPHIIRKNRTSVAVLDGTESHEELTALGHDIFDYFGLGCRNVSKLLIPEDFDLDRFFKAIYPFNPIIHHKKYAGNYDYNKAVYLLNKANLLDNGFLLLLEENTLHSPLGMLYYQRYTQPKEAQEYLAAHKDRLQCIVGHGHIPFGRSQSPRVMDYADNVDTLAFLAQLN